MGLVDIVELGVQGFFAIGAITISLSAILRPETISLGPLGTVTPNTYPPVLVGYVFFFIALPYIFYFSDRFSA